MKNFLICIGNGTVGKICIDNLKYQRKYKKYKIIKIIKNEKKKIFKKKNL